MSFFRAVMGERKEDESVETVDYDDNPDLNKHIKRTLDNMRKVTESVQRQIKTLKMGLVVIEIMQYFLSFVTILHSNLNQ